MCRYQSRIQETDGIAERVVFFGELLELVEERADAHPVVMLFLPVDHAEGTVFLEPARCRSQKVNVVRYEYEVLFDGVFKEDIVVLTLREVIYSSLYLPPALAESSDETPINVGVREQRKARHLGLARPVHRSCNMAVFRSWLFRRLPSVAVNVVFPLAFEPFRCAVLALNRRVDLIFAIVIEGQGCVDVGQIELGKLFLDTPGRIATVEVKDNVFDGYSSSLDAGLSTSDLRVLRDM